MLSVFRQFCSAIKTKLSSCCYHICYLSHLQQHNTNFAAENEKFSSADLKKTHTQVPSNTVYIHETRRHHCPSKLFIALQWSHVELTTHAFISSHLVLSLWTPLPNLSGCSLPVIMLPVMNEANQQQTEYNIVFRTRHLVHKATASPSLTQITFTTDSKI